MSAVDRRAIRVLLAALDVEQRHLAEMLGYRPGYIANILNGHTPASAAFRRAFGEALAELLLGRPDPPPGRYPAEPLRALVRRRAAAAPCKTQFYEDLGVTPQGLNKRDLLSGALVDRLCCALGVHLTAVYGPNGEVREES